MTNLIEETTRYDLVEIDRLEQNPFNARRQFRKLDELADSIVKHGLLQNLVVREDEESGKLIIKAGSRRFEAIKKIHEGKVKIPKDAKYKPGDPIPVLIDIGDPFAAVNVVENIHREEVPVWDLGYRYNELRDAGLTLAQIAAEIGKSQDHVSFAGSVARDVHPEVIDRIRKYPPQTVSKTALIRLANLRDEAGYPNLKKQQALLDLYLQNPHQRRPKTGRGGSRKTILQNRFIYLKQAKVPPEHYRTWAIMMKFLSGQTANLEWHDKAPIF